MEKTLSMTILLRRTQMLIKKSNDRKKYLVGISMFLLLIFVGCMSMRNAEKHETAVPLVKSQFDGKTIAILPVSEGKISTSMATESTRNLKLAINEAIDNKVAKLIPNAKFVRFKTTAMTLNDANKLSLLDDLFKTYEVTGAYDKKTIDALCNLLNANYIVVSKIVVGKMDTSIVMKAVQSTLETAIVSKQTKDVVWGGSGSYKKGGTLGFGSVDDKDHAGEIVDLAFSKYE